MEILKIWHMNQETHIRRFKESQGKDIARGMTTVSIVIIMLNST